MIPPLVAGDGEAVRGWLSDAASAAFLAVDTETTGFDPHLDEVRVVQLAAGPDLPVLVLDVGLVDLEHLRTVLTDPGLLKVFHNAAFDLQMLAGAGLDVIRVADTMLAQQILDAGRPDRMGSGLAAIAERRLGETLDKSVRTTFDRGPLSREQVHYAAKDARVTWDIFGQQNRELVTSGLVEVARCEFSAVGPIASMQRRGIGLDTSAWAAVLSEVELHLPSLEAAAQAALVSEATQWTLLGPELVNLDSPEQVQRALAGVGVEVESTRNGVLADHADHPAVTALLAYRQAAKLTSGWGGDWASRVVNPVTRRVHPRVRQLVGAGRMAHSDPNLTQVPKDPQYRGCFVAADGNALVVADYSQQELRVLAAASGDDALAEVFRRGGDLHAETAAMVFGGTAADVTPPQRAAAKALNFGLMYGMGAPGFARATDMSVEQARATMDDYFAAYPQLGRWFKRVESSARRTQVVRTILGRTTHVGPAAGTYSRNAPIQGGGADMTKLAVAEADRRLRARFGDGTAERPVGLVLTVHDELVAEVPSADADEGAALLAAAMRDAGEALLGDVPVAVDVRVGRSWA